MIYHQLKFRLITLGLRHAIPLIDYEPQKPFALNHAGHFEYLFLPVRQ